MNCLACGANGDGEAIYPYPDDCIDDSEPLPKLFCIDAVPTIHGDKSRMCVVCHECWHKLDVDMWISEKCWESLSPQTKFSDLQQPEYVLPDGTIGQYIKGCRPIWEPKHYLDKMR